MYAVIVKQQCFKKKVTDWIVISIDVLTDKHTKFQQLSKKAIMQQHYLLTHNWSRTWLQLSLEITFLKLKDYSGCCARVVSSSRQVTYARGKSSALAETIWDSCNRIRCCRECDFNATSMLNKSIEFNRKSKQSGSTQLSIRKIDRNVI